MTCVAPVIIISKCIGKVDEGVGDGPRRDPVGERRRAAEGPWEIKSDHVGGRVRRRRVLRADDVELAAQ